MAFQSLYRKHRPQTFGELVGQETVSTALRNAVREGRVGHAYLFSGPRGTGKTTSARLLAKALNCTGPREGLPPGEPCNSCPSCVEITAGTSMDVLELDAASNNKVDEMRALLERVAYRSAGGARKVYIIDEVHMLTPGASAALLKTLEEPPEHVIFVLATTDPQKVLATIRSRTQHFEFSLLPADRLAAHLADIAAREGVEAAPETLATIARRAGGSARDALSLLDQALAYGDGQLRPEQVAALFGGTAASVRGGIVDALAAGDVAGLLERLDAQLGAGVDARNLADDLLRHLREVFLVLSCPGRIHLETPEEERAALAAQGEVLGTAAVVRALETLGEAAIEIRRAPDPRLVLEVTLVRLARRDVSTLEALADRVARLERALDDLRGAIGSGVAPAVGAPRAARETAPDRRARSGADSASAADPAAAEAPQAARAGPQAALGALRKSGAAPAGPGRTAARTAPGPPAAPAPAAEAPAGPTTPQPSTASGGPAAPEGPPGAATPQPASSSGGPAAPGAPAGSATPQPASSSGGPVAPGAPSPAGPTVPIGGTPAADDPLTLDDVTAAWAKAVEGFRPRLKAMAKEAHPVRIEGETVVVGLPLRFEKVHLPTITGEAPTVIAALSELLGRRVRLKVVVDDTVVSPLAEGVLPEAPAGPDPGAGAGAAEMVAEMTRPPEPPGGGRGVDSPVGLVIETFGASIESETVRE
ncbi:MAG: polymerase subunit gamma/tau [Actinomycetota bacterium]|nr:polymerase subunit gamma/tau [Actinomycetota bacterium]